MSLEVLGIIVAFVVIFLIILPFLVIKDVRISESIHTSSLKELEKRKQELLKHYLKHEKMLEEKEISKGIWTNRTTLIMKKYIDVVRRMDQLKK